MLEELKGAVENQLICDELFVVFFASVEVLTGFACICKTIIFTHSLMSGSGVDVLPMQQPQGFAEASQDFWPSLLFAFLGAVVQPCEAPCCHGV